MTLLALIFALLSVHASSVPASRDAESARRALETRYEHARTLKAAFFERYSDGNGGVQAESGTVYFSKPGRMRWEYESPEQKLFIVDGTNVWFYVPSDRTASRAKIGESSDWRTPLAFLTGKTNLGRLCRNIEILDPKPDRNRAENPSEPGNTVLRCIPRVDSGDAGEQIRDVLLEADPDARLVRVVIRQAGKLETEFRFGHWEENLPIPEAKFHFAPPAGVVIVDESTLAGSVH
jgi:outer membrane lipoprotein carrier protein